MTEEVIQLAEYGTTDAIFVLAVAGLCLLWAYTMGKDFVVTLYTASFASIPFAWFLTEILLSNFLAGQDFPVFAHFPVVYVISTLILVFLMSRNSFFEPYVATSSWETPVFSIATAGNIGFWSAMYLVHWSGVPVEELPFSWLGELIFVHAPWMYIWLGLPFVLLLLVKGDD